MVDESIGYRKPPRHSKFKKGVTGNPKGRPKRKPFAAAETIDSVLNSTAEYRERGKTKVATRRELTIRTHVNRALKGDVKSAETLLKLRAHAQRHGDAGVHRIPMSDWLPDYSGQTGEQKTKEFASKDKTNLPQWWNQSGNDPTSTGS
jgi:hypothetical protein